MPIIKDILDRPNSIIDDYWLGLGDLHNKEIINPLLGRTKEEKDKPGMLELRLMRDPHYLWFAAKHLLNVELSPMQAAFLYELWTHSFPMFVASRGAGKCLEPDCPVLTPLGWKPIGKLNIGDDVYGSDGQRAKVKAITPLQKQLDFYRVTLRDGRTIEACKDHQWKVWYKNSNKNKSESVWEVATTEKIFQKYFYERKDRDGKPTKEFLYALPVNKPVEFSQKSYLLHPYVLGALLGDGGMTHKTITISNLDKDLLDRFERLLPTGYKLSNPQNGKDYRIIRSDKSLPPFRKLLEKLGLFGKNSHTKFIPEDYLFGSLEQRKELLFGLMDTDGCNTKNVPYYYTVSDRLSNNVQELIRSLGIACSHRIKKPKIGDKVYSDCHVISLYTNIPVFTLTRKLGYLDHKKSKAGQSKYEKTFIVNIEYIGKRDGLCIQVDSPDHTYITKDYIVTHNTFLLAVFAMLKMALENEEKVVVAGAAFRQSRFVYEYCKKIWEGADVLRSLKGTDDGPRFAIDRCEIKFHNSYIYFIPIGTGEKIRGYRATTVIADEFASIDPEIFEVVIRGFGAVPSQPVESQKAHYRKEALKRFRNYSDEDLLDDVEGYQPKSNSCIISGTADYDFKHFADYWRKYIVFIRSGGDPEKPVRLPNGEVRYLKEYYEDGVPEDFSSDDYTILRVPYDLIPKGFMDNKMVSSAKATYHKSAYQKEFGAIFPADSEGFFRRTLIESCVASDKKPIEKPSGRIWFDAAIQGIPNKEYVYGIDPAAEDDNLSIVILEMWPDHNRVVYGWSTNVANFKERKKRGLVDENDYYRFCARKIRNLMHVFPTENIALDMQGGGRALLEALGDKALVRGNEDIILPTNRILHPDKELDTDVLPGLKIVHPCQFADAVFTSEANHGLKKDMEDKALLFPRFDAVTLELAATKDGHLLKEMQKKYKIDQLYDTLEDCVMEIEDLKNELTTIKMTMTGATGGGRERWDTPETVTQEGKKTRMKKDRYSALILANYIARKINRAPAPIEYSVIGGFSHELNKHKDRTNYQEPAYQGPDWVVSKSKSFRPHIVRRR